MRYHGGRSRGFQGGVQRGPGRRYMQRTPGRGEGQEKYLGQI